MPTQEGVLTVILVAIVANLALVIGLLVVPRIRARRAVQDDTTDMSRGVLLRAHLFGADGPAVATSAARYAEPGNADAVYSSAARPALAGAVPGAAATDASDDTDAADDDEHDDAIGDVDHADPTTGFEGPAAWTRRLNEENARVQRYGHPATIVLVELGGLDRLAERLGSAAAERLIPPIATTMRRNARSADCLARLSPTRFAALLPYTDEVRAINFVERVRSACDVWLEAGAVSLRLSIGWAEISKTQPVDPAILAAERRLNGERHRLGNGDAQDVEGNLDVVAAQMPAAKEN
jgi:diguanylate cyclase (GGDEF)-like protein